MIHDIADIVVTLPTTEHVYDIGVQVMKSFTFESSAQLDFVCNNLCLLGLILNMVEFDQKINIRGVFLK